MTAHPFSLDGRVALVTGAGRGLGFEIAKGLAQAGAHVLLNGLRVEQVNAAAAAIRKAGGTATALPFDVTDEAAVEAAFAHISTDPGRLDILVNNVGVRDRRPLFDFSLDDVRRLLNADLVSPFNLARLAARQMMRQGHGGRIINMTSIAGPISGVGDAVYTSAKAGLAGLTRALAAELGPHGINVNAVAPGVFGTETNAALVADDAVKAMLKTRTSLGRSGEPHEIAGAAVFLASPAASYVAGQVLVVDGGYLAHS
ncbi:SDR family oxidoreductase [Zavarzinia sp. CC-PAN008]|uniref:SDR family oxidoreductase n=1 Tax=Zavarzinia sp. CC-PAN008 TaxID=3243332 RepID=UPI003F743012